MGRWQPSTDEGYERLVKGNVMRAQQHIAERIRKSQGKPDELDEEVVLMELGEMMHEDGFNEEVIATQIELLRYFSEKSEPNMKRQRSWSMGSWEEVGREERESFVNMIHRLNVDQDDEAPVEEQAANGPDDVLPGEDETFHKVGECYRLPGVHFKKYILGELMPEEGARCASQSLAAKRWWQIAVQV